MSRVLLNIPPPKGVKSFGFMTFIKTITEGVIAIGNYVPSILILPKLHFKKRTVNSASLGVIDSANPPKCFNHKIVVEYMMFFGILVKPSNENSVLLAFDNHKRHVSIL